jgi:hypothetical protein
MPSAAYYQRHRDECCERAREYSRLKQRVQQEYLTAHPEEVETYRNQQREAYYAKRANRIKRRLEAWIANEGVADAVKTTLKELLTTEKYKELKPADLRPFEKLIASSSSPSTTISE